MSAPPKFSPGMPSLEELGLSRQHIRGKPSTSPNMVSDGRKRVNYRPNSAQSVRPFQSPPTAAPPIQPAVPSVQPIQPAETRIGAIPKRTQPEGARLERVKANRPWTEREEKIYPTLTITPHGEAIAGYIQELPVLAIDFPTGTGKTRYIPYFMAMKGFVVRVAIPTTVAVRDAYQFQRKYSTLRVGY
ncbi:MAG TPA: hypothetical protein VJ044_12030, partial [Candidatus Hodarchaeales archaeon]|nr:hypothetical protein [Candidatus Hodarchaeales archaeon]